VKKGRIRNIVNKVNDMATINDLLYNYQDTNEFVCSDGRMSVNGICQVEQPDSVDASNITKEIIETSAGGKGGGGGGNKDISIEKGKFEWDFDKETKIDGYKNTIDNKINSYNGWIQENLGISTNVQNAARIASSGTALATGGSLAAVAAPWAIPFLAGGAINSAERDRIQNITDQDTQGDINTIDMMTYDTPKPGEVGFNIHQDKGVTSNGGFGTGKSDAGHAKSGGSGMHGGKHF